MYNITKEDIEEQIDLATDKINSGENCMHGMSYEEGVKFALEWVIGDISDKPIEE